MGRITVFALTRPADDATVHAIEQLAPHAGRLVVVGASTTDEARRTRLAAIADEVRDDGSLLDSPLPGGADEVVLTDDSWFGPFGGFDDLFARATIATGPIWALGPLDEPMMIGISRAGLDSPEWSARWTSATADANRRQLLARLASAVDPAAVLYPEGNLPVLPRSILVGDPLELDRSAPGGRWILDAAAESGYPVELIWASLVGTVQPRTLNANGGMLEILPSPGVVFDPARPPTIVAIVHIFYEEMVDELLDRLATLPVGYDVVVTTTDEAKAESIRAAIRARSDPALGTSEVRVLASNRGRDQSAFYVGCRDVLLDERYDLVVKLHSKRSTQNEVTGRFFRRQQLENLLATPDYAAGVLALFQREAGLGVVFPPMIHSGLPTMGGAWFDNRPAVEAVCARLGIESPLDDASPLAPYGGMFIARRAALLPIAEHAWSYDEYPAGDEYADGTLAHVQERLVAYAAASRGFHTRTVATAAYAAMSHTMLEVKLDRTLAGIKGWPAEQADVVHERAGVESQRLLAIGRSVDASRRDAILFAVGRTFPGITRVLRRLRRR